MHNPLVMRLYSWFFLLFHGMRGWITRALSPDRTGLKTFRENYVPEGLPPISAAARAEYHTFVRCTGCGACEPVCPLTSEADPLAWRGPMAVVLSMARAAPHYAECLPALEYFDRCGNCRACENACPQVIPIRRVAEVMRQALREIDEAQPGRR